jgi:hypothetical protein
LFRKHKKLGVLGIIFALLSAAGVTGYFLAANEPRIVEVTPEVSDMPAEADNARIEKGATVEWDYEYRMCGHHIYLHCEADETMIGLTFSELQAANPDVRIVSFEAKNVSLKMSFDCYCPRHYILKQYRDELAIYRTVLGTQEQEVYVEVPIRFSVADEDEQPVLETGKLFDSLEELENYLENLET